MRKLVWIVAALSYLLMVAPTFAQQRGGQQVGQQATQQQQMARQQMMMQMEQTMQRLHRLEQQAGLLAQNMKQRASQGAGGQFATRDRAMLQLCDSVSDLSRGMLQTMDRIQQHLNDPALAGDRDMQRDMDRLRLHVEEMTGPLEEAIQDMDRIQDRLHKPDDGS